MPGCACRARAGGFRPGGNEPGEAAQRPVGGRLRRRCSPGPVEQVLGVASLAKVGPKHLLGPMYLVLTYNRGAAFSFGTGASPVIAAVAVALVIGVAFYSRRLVRGMAPLPVMVGAGPSRRRSRVQPGR